MHILIPTKILNAPNKLAVGWIYPVVKLTGMVDYQGTYGMSSSIWWSKIWRSTKLKEKENANNYRRNIWSEAKERFWTFGQPGVPSSLFCKYRKSFRKMSWNPKMDNGRESVAHFGIMSSYSSFQKDGQVVRQVCWCSHCKNKSRLLLAELS